MSVTRLKRKHRKNIARANNETKKIKDLLRTPVLKNVDLDELKARFAQSTPAPAKDEKKQAKKTDVAAPKAKNEPKAKETSAKETKPEDTKPEETKSEGIFSKVAHVASAAADAVKQAAAGAVDAVSHSSIVEKAKEAASHAADAVTHSAAFETAQQAAQNVVKGAKQVISSSEQTTEEPAKNEEAKVNQTGTPGFDEAEAVTKPVNSDGQEGEHPKPEIHL